MDTRRRTGAADAGLLLMRLAVGAVFAFHGGQKLFGAFGGPGLAGFAGYLDSLGVPAPGPMAFAAAAAELAGGLLVAAGLGTRLVAVGLVHGGGFDAATGGMEYPLTLGLVTAGLGLTGPGRLTAAALGRGRGVPAGAPAEITA